MSYYLWDPSDLIPIERPLDQKGLEKKRKYNNYSKFSTLPYAPNIREFTPRINFPIISLNQPRKRNLNGLSIVDATHIQDPDEIYSCNISNSSYNGVNEKDMKSFTQLETVIASENQLLLEHFSCFPALKELILSSNQIINIPCIPVLITKLEILDLSFNELTSDSIINLGNYIELVELNLSGNKIKTVPDTFLEVLNLSNNRIKDEEDLDVIKEMRNMKKLNLSKNQILSVKIGYCFGTLENGMQLEILDLSNNNVLNENYLSGILSLSRLEILYIYNNPFLHYNYNLSSLMTIQKLLIYVTENSYKTYKPTTYVDFPITKIENKEIIGKPIKSFNSNSVEYGEILNTQSKENGESFFITEAKIREQPQIPEFHMPTTNVNHNHKKLKQAMNSLRYILSHPLTSTNDLNEFDEEFNFMKENKITKLRKKPKIIRNSDSSRIADTSKEVKKESELPEEDPMILLNKMISQVIESYKS